MAMGARHGARHAVLKGSGAAGAALAVMQQPGECRDLPSLSASQLVPGTAEFQHANSAPAGTALAVLQQTGMGRKPSFCLRKPALYQAQRCSSVQKHLLTSSPSSAGSAAPGAPCSTASRRHASSGSIAHAASSTSAGGTGRLSAAACRHEQEGGSC